MFSHLCIFRVSVAVSFLLFAGVSANAALLSGSINLPSGQVAASGGTQFIVSTQPSLGVQSTITIPTFQSSALFSLNLPNGASYRVRFDCVLGCAGLDITTAGFWSQTTGVVGLQSNATSYLSAQNQNIDIQLEAADTFSGVISLPDGFQATGDASIAVTVSAAVFGEAAAFTQTIRPQEGEVSWPFTIGVPSNETLGGWNFDVQCQNCNAPDQVHYPTSVTGDPTSLEIGRRFFYLKNRDNLSMEMTFISLVEPETNDTVIAPILLLLDE